MREEFYCDSLKVLDTKTISVVILKPEQISAAYLLFVFAYSKSRFSYDAVYLQEPTFSLTVGGQEKYFLVSI